MNLIKNWPVYPVPVDKKKLAEYNYSRDEWTVFIKNGDVNVANKDSLRTLSKLPFEIKKTKNFDIDGFGGNISCLKISDGYLVGFYRGEWGGSLYWFSASGKSYYKISSDEVVMLINRNGEFYAIQGLSHLSISFGSIIKIEKQNGKWVSNTYMQLPDAPYAITLDNSNNFWIVDSQNLLKINADKSYKVIVKDAVWLNGLYPNSVVINDGVLYSGMRAGVFRYNINTAEQAWLMNK